MKRRATQFFVLILLGFLLPHHLWPQEPDTDIFGLTSSVKSSIKSSGDFTNRLRLVNEYIRLSVVSCIQSGELEFIEPSFMSEPLYFGRLKLKGAVREFYTSGTISAGSTVFTENSGFSVTDSFSRSSRYGAVIRKGQGGSILPGSSLWAFRTNSGGLTTGLFLNSMEVLKTDYLLVETDMISSAGIGPAGSTSSWFADRPLLPEQLVINCTADLRLVLSLPWSCAETAAVKKIDSGRKVMRPEGDSFSAAVSAAGRVSLPAYTEQGGAFRGFVWLGTEAVSLRGFLELNSDSYISPSGLQRPSAKSYGCRVFFNTGDPWALNLSSEYNHRQGYPQVQPGRVIETDDDFSVISELNSGSFRLRLNGLYSWLFDIHGVFADKGVIKADFRTESHDIIMDAEVGIAGFNIFTVPEEQNIASSVAFSWNPGWFTAEAEFDWKANLSPGLWSADEAKVQLKLKAAADSYTVNIKFSINIFYTEDGIDITTLIEEISPEFSIDLESFEAARD